MATALSRASTVNVVAANTKAVKKVPVKKAAAAPKPAGSKTSLSFLAKVEQLKLLSQVEKLGLLSKAEAAGFTLSKIEQAGLLSLAEESGVLSLVASPATPGLLNTVGLASLAAAVALVVAVPDDSTSLVVAQAAGAGLLGAAGLASLTGSSVLGNLQRL